MHLRQAHPAAIAALLLVASCARVHPVQLAPPVTVPSGLVWGYGVERVEGRPDQARRRAYLGAVDDLLSRGPVMVSRAVVDSTRADDDSVTRTIETTFRLRAASIIEPRYIREGFEDGFAWVVVGAGEEEIERGWQEFLKWREVRIAEAEVLFEQAAGPSRILQLEASLEILEEAGAEMAPGLLYHRVRLALDVEREEVARLDRFRVEVDGLIQEGNVLGAERRLSEALVSGLSLAEYESYTFQIADQRSRAEAEVVAGDTFYNSGRYREAMDRYERARRFDVNHPGLATRAARAESAHRRARGETTQRTLGTIGGVVSEFFRWQREEARDDREEERREREDREWEEERRREEERRDEERRAEREAAESRAARQRADREARNRARENEAEDEERAESEPEHRVVQPTIFRTPSQGEAPRKAQRVDP